MIANTQQVGGLHYKTTYNHWDFVLSVGLGYFEGQITKYVCRWRKKNGLQDLQKAAHFLDKLIESRLGMDREPSHLVNNEVVLNVDVERFSTANSLTPIETEICFLLAIWSNITQLKAVRGLIKTLIDGATPVPVEDSNRHARMSNEL